MRALPGAAGPAIMDDEMSVPDDLHSAESLPWALMAPGLPRLAARVDSLEERLRLTLAALRVLDGEASWMAREAEGALELALDLLLEEWSQASPAPAPPALQR
jgi:hypothetical protein